MTIFITDECNGRCIQKFKLIIGAMTQRNGAIALEYLSQKDMIYFNLRLDVHHHGSTYYIYIIAFI